MLDRNRNSPIGFEVGDRTKRTYFKLFKEINERYNVDYLCTDGLEAYSSYRFDSIPENRGKRYFPKKYFTKQEIKRYEANKEELDKYSLHIVSKAETSLIEALNKRIRHYLARFRRDTLCFSKLVEMIEISLYLLFHKFYWQFE